MSDYLEIIFSRRLSLYAICFLRYCKGMSLYIFEHTVVVGNVAVSTFLAISAISQSVSSSNR